MSALPLGHYALSQDRAKPPWSDSWETAWSSLAHSGKLGVQNRSPHPILPPPSPPQSHRIQGAGWPAGNDLPAGCRAPGRWPPSSTLGAIVGTALAAHWRGWPEVGIDLETLGSISGLIRFSLARGGRALPGSGGNTTARPGGCSHDERLVRERQEDRCMEASNGVAQCQAGPQGRGQSKPAGRGIPSPQSQVCSPEVGDLNREEKAGPPTPILPSLLHRPEVTRMQDTPSARVPGGIACRNHSALQILHKEKGFKFPP